MEVLRRYTGTFRTEIIQGKVSRHMSEMHYDAFISYRHTERDTKVAKQVQHDLEHFRIPSPIREKYGIKRIEKVFRDSEELAVTPDLSNELSRALTNSDRLIVICSEDYMRSQWCMQELDTFLALKGPENVICVLSEGEPPSIFPEQLRIAKEGLKERTEPLACDYRGDRAAVKRTELPRLVSAVIGCGYDELVQRYQRYRRRKLTAILSATAALLLIAVSYLIWSNIQISRNYRQSLINESKTLSEQSMGKLRDSDRISAIELALKALKGSDTSRPEVTEALHALSRSTYAYASPYRTAETKRIDRGSDIVSFFISRNGRYLVYLENSGQLTVLGTSDLAIVATHELPFSSVPSVMEEGKDGEVLFFSDGFCISFDYLTGKQNWRDPLSQQVIGSVHISPDLEITACTDSYKIDLLTSDGKLLRRLMIPDGSPYYIVDSCWSEDGKALLLKMRDQSAQGTYRLAVMDVDSGSFSVVSERFRNLGSVSFISADDLLYVTDDSQDTSGSFSGYSFLYDTVYSLFRFDGKSVSLLEQFSSNLADARVSLRHIDGLSGYEFLFIGSELYICPRDGTHVDSYSFPCAVFSILKADKDGIDALLSDGTRASLSFADRSQTIYKIFMEGTEEAVTFISEGKLSYLALKGGDLSVYSYVYDDEITFPEGPSFPRQLDSYHMGKDHFWFAAGKQLFCCTLSDMSISSMEVLSDGDAYHFLCSGGNRVYVLRISSGGTLSVLEYNGSSLACEMPLNCSDYYVSKGYITYPYSEDDAFFLHYGYLGGSYVTAGNGRIYSHGPEDPSVIGILDLTSRKYSSFIVDLPEGCSLTFGGVNDLPSPLYVSGKGNLLFTIITVKEKGHELYKGAFIDLSDGSVLISDMEMNTSDIVSWNGDWLYVRKEDRLVISDISGKTVYEISFPSQSPVSFDSRGKTMTAVFPDGRVGIYSDGSLMKYVELDISMTSYYDHRVFRYVYRGDLLYLFIDNSLSVIRLDDDSVTPLYTVDTGCYGYVEKEKFLIMSTNLPGGDDTAYHIAVFREYSSDKLIERAEKQLSLLR